MTCLAGWSRPGIRAASRAQDAPAQLVGSLGDSPTNPALVSLVVGNEGNITVNPDSSDGAYPNAQAAIVRGTIAAKRELTTMGSSARVGTSLAVTSAASDGAYLRNLTALGGREFAGALDFLGSNVYPGIWPAGTDDHYGDMRRVLESARTSVESEPGLAGRPVDILEIGAPMADEAEQAARLESFVRAALDEESRLGIASFLWFDLWDADTGSSNPYHHHGLLRSNLVEKPAFGLFRRLAAGAG